MMTLYHLSHLLQNSRVRIDAFKFYLACNKLCPRYVSVHQPCIFTSRKLYSLPHIAGDSHPQAAAQTEDTAQTEDGMALLTHHTMVFAHRFSHRIESFMPASTTPKTPSTFET